MNKIIEALKLVNDNGSMFWDTETNKFILFYLLSYTSGIEYIGRGDTPEEAAEDFLNNYKDKFNESIQN